MQSDYSEIVPLDIGKDYDLPVIESFNVLLDISSVKSDKKITFEYSKEWYNSLESFEAQAYGTTNVDTIKKIEGKYLDISDEKCRNNMCKLSVKKTKSEFLRIKLTIPRDPKKYKSIKFKYEQENSFGILNFNFNHPYFSLALGVVLSIPNILWFIIRRCQRKMSATFGTFYI